MEFSEERVRWSRDDPKNTFRFTCFRFDRVVKEHSKSKHRLVAYCDFVLRSCFAVDSFPLVKPRGRNDAAIAKNSSPLAQFCEIFDLGIKNYFFLAFNRHHIAPAHRGPFALATLCPDNRPPGTGSIIQFVREVGYVFFTKPELSRQESPVGARELVPSAHEFMLLREKLYGISRDHV